MSSTRQREELMLAKIASREVRRGRKQAIVEHVKPDAKVVLDLGCGSGALTELIATNHPESFVIGLEKSAAVLSVLRKERRGENMNAVRADVAHIPIRLKSVDSVIASSVLHEILRFEGGKALREVLRSARAILKPDGQLIIFDHAHPGGGSVDVRLTEDLLKKLEIFGERFRPRKIRYRILENRLVNMSLRDFYDFITKASFLDSQIEMNETHTPFTVKQLKSWLQDSGFTVVFERRMEAIEDYLKYYEVETKRRKFPNRTLLLEARRGQS